MEREAILAEVKRVFVDHLSIQDLSESTHLFQDLKLDSIQQLTLVVELENRFQLRFEESDEKDIATVRDVVDVLARRLAER